MDSKIKDLWNNNKILFFLALPLIALYFGRNILIDLLVSNSNKVVNDLSKKDDQLKMEEIVANTKANQIIEDANQAAALRKPLDENWDKK